MNKKELIGFGILISLVLISTSGCIQQTEEIIYENTSFPEDYNISSLTGTIEKKIEAQGSRSEYSYFILKVDDMKYLLKSYYWGDKVEINPDFTYEQLEELNGKRVKIEGTIQKNPITTATYSAGVYFQLLVKKITLISIELKTTDNEDKDENQTTKGGFRCASDQDCPEDNICYNSQYCPMTPTGAECNEQEGDLLCHKKCEVDSDCSPGLTCKDIEIIRGDAITFKRMCMP